MYVAALLFGAAASFPVRNARDQQRGRSCVIGNEFHATFNQFVFALHFPATTSRIQKVWRQQRGAAAAFQNPFHFRIDEHRHARGAREIIVCTLVRNAFGIIGQPARRSDQRTVDTLMQRLRYALKPSSKSRQGMTLRR